MSDELSKSVQTLEIEVSNLKRDLAETKKGFVQHQKELAESELQRYGHTKFWTGISWGLNLLFAGIIAYLGWKNISDIPSIVDQKVREKIREKVGYDFNQKIKKARADAAEIEGLRAGFPFSKGKGGEVILDGTLLVQHGNDCTEITPHEITLRSGPGLARIVIANTQSGALVTAARRGNLADGSGEFKAEFGVFPDGNTASAGVNLYTPKSPDHELRYIRVKAGDKAFSNVQDKPE